MFAPKGFLEVEAKCKSDATATRIKSMSSVVLQELACDQRHDGSGVAWTSVWFILLLFSYYIVEL